MKPLILLGGGGHWKSEITDSVDGAAGVILTAKSAVTDCQPNENVEAVRVGFYVLNHYCPRKHVNTSPNSLFALRFLDQIALPTFEMSTVTPNLRFGTFGRYDGVPWSHVSKI